MAERHDSMIPSVRGLQDFDRAFDGAFALVAYIMNRHLIDHMLRSAKLLTDGDHVALLVWGVLAHQNVAHLMPPGSMPSAVLTEKGRLPGDQAGMRPMLLRDIAAITGIPRETTRRKLVALAAQGFVERTGQCWVVSSQRTEPELRDFTRETTRRLLATTDDIRAVLAAADSRAAGAAGTSPARG